MNTPAVCTVIGAAFVLVEVVVPDAVDEEPAEDNVVTEETALLALLDTFDEELVGDTEEPVEDDGVTEEPAGDDVVAEEPPLVDGFDEEPVEPVEDVATEEPAVLDAFVDVLED